MLKQSVSQARVKTGGKLYIAGEYSVLTPGSDSPNPVYPYLHVSRGQGSTKHTAIF